MMIKRIDAMLSSAEIKGTDLYSPISRSRLVGV